ncbi:putative spindle pole body component [Clavispora lusitaniae]|uniref:Spindle pole body component n=1 Tax=Clavispora lusitaniae TaxID=36911 RepID=A0AA91PV21_CLALS|nr:putative spindle pole body component [Clavispora lusitaniae]
MERTTNRISFLPIIRNQLSEAADLQTQQCAIIKDVLLGLLGYEGTYVRFSDKFNPDLLHDRIHGPDHKIAKHIDVSLKAITKKLLRYGKYIYGLKSFSEVYNQPRFGRVNQKLCSEIVILIKQYKETVLNFEESFKFNPSFTLNQMSNEMSLKLSDRISHLYEIIIAVHTESEGRNYALREATSSATMSSTSSRTANFDSFLQTIKNDIHLMGPIDVSTDTNSFEVCKGGLVLQIIQNRMNQFSGDAVSFSFLSRVFDAVSKDYIYSLNLWLSRGEVDDPFEEFFVKKNNLPSNIFYSNIEKYWDELYVIKLDGIIDQFASKDLQMKVLLTGKYLSILKQSTGVASLDHIFDTISGTLIPHPIESLHAPDITLKILQYYKRANNLLLKLLFEGYNFTSLMENIHQIFLLKDSYKIDIFLDRSFHDLARNKYHTSITKTIKCYNDIFLLDKKKSHVSEVQQDTWRRSCSINDVLRLCETFNFDSTSFYDMARDIINIKSIDTDNTQGNESASSAIKKIVRKSLQRRQLSSAEMHDRSSSVSIDNLAIVGANIDLELPFPLGLIVGENSVFEYQLLFKLQMILKFASKSMDESWKDINLSTVWKYKGFSSPVRKMILRCRSLNARMKNFMNEIQNYINFSITDPNYLSLVESLKKLESSIRSEKQNSTLVNRVESIHLLRRHRHKNSSVFDEKIVASGHGQASLGNIKKYDSCDVYEMTQKIGTYLNNIVRDSMVTSDKLLSCIKVLLDCIIHFAITVSRLKKTLISMDEHLLRSFAKDFPEKFSKIEFNESLVNSRIAGLNEVLTKHWRKFNNSLMVFIEALKEVASENSSFFSLIERLQVI